MRRHVTIAGAILMLSGAACESAEQKRIDGAREASLTLEHAVSSDLTQIAMDGLRPVASTVRVVIVDDGVFVDGAPPMIVRYRAGSLSEADSGDLRSPERALVPLTREASVRGALLLAPLQRLLEPLGQREQRLSSAAGAGRSPPALTVFAASGASAGTVLDVAHTAEQAGFRVQFAVRQGNATMALPRRSGEPEERPSELALRVMVTPAGMRVSGTGGTLAPGCQTVGSADGVTLERRRGELAWRALRDCLFRVKQQFPAETKVTVRADGPVPIAELLRVVAVAWGDPATPMFPDATLGFDAEPKPPQTGRSGLGVTPGAGSGSPGAPGASVTERVVGGRVLIAGGSDVDGSGTLDPSQVLRTIRGRLRAFGRCYESSLSVDPSLAGRVVVRFTIEPRGTVSEATVTEDSIGDASLARCVVGVIRRLRWGQGPEGGSVTFSYPLVFAPPTDSP